MFARELFNADESYFYFVLITSLFNLFYYDLYIDALSIMFFLTLLPPKYIPIFPSVLEPEEKRKMGTCTMV